MLIDSVGSINSPLRGRGTFGSGWHKQKLSLSLTERTGLVLPEEEEERDKSLGETMGPEGLAPA